VPALQAQSLEFKLHSHKKNYICTGIKMNILVLNVHFFLLTLKEIKTFSLASGSTVVAIHCASWISQPWNKAGRPVLNITYRLHDFEHELSHPALRDKT
jgi:hypothetical protein